MLRPDSLLLRCLCGLGLLCTFLLTSAGGAEKEASPEETKPYGLTKRIPLTTSRVIGSPDRPLPYRSQRAFAKLQFKRPLYLGFEPGTDRFLVVEQKERILAFPNDPEASETKLFLELKDHDLYSFCFHPRYAENRFVYIFSNGLNSEKVKKNRILRYTVTADEPRRCDPDSLHVVIEWVSNGHNGGEMAFGPDGYLYISSGDGTSDSDGDVTGQVITDLTSGILRIDVEHPDEGKGYSIPKDNPFLHIEGARGELWAFGFRNPWRMTFDQDGNLWVGDIGQDLWELIHVVQKGGNYGWSVFEGNHPFYLERARGPAPILPPTIEHPHSEARSITGGIAYQGTRYPELKGAYLYGDYSTGKVWGARYSDGKVTWNQELADTPVEILGFAEDREGRVYVVDYGTGGIFELVPTPKDLPTYDFPRKLSETGLFVDVATHQTQPGLIPYSVNAPLWSDGADKQRFIALPGETRIEFSETGHWKFPEQAVLVKSFALELEAGKPESKRYIETRLMTFQQGEWVGYSYIWNDEQTDAELVEAAGRDRVLTIRDPQAPGGERTQVWRYPSRAECMVCHSRAAGFVLGPTTLQMNGDHDYGGVVDNQLRTLAHIGVFGRKRPKKEGETEAPEYDDITLKPVDQLPRLVDPYDPAADLETRARAYLHSNCAQCHVEAGGGNSAINLHFRTSKEGMRAIGVAPLHHKFDLEDPQIIAPGAPERSVLYHRMSHLGAGRMPPLGSSVIDQEAVKMLAEWIRQLPPSGSSPTASAGN